MKRALVTMASGAEFERLSRIARPSLDEFADRHGYTIVTPQLECDRPPSWWKVPALIAALAEYDEALWVDADMVIVDPADDLDVPAEAWQALVEHRTGDGFVPNCGFWFVRKPMLEWLPRVWQQTHRISAGWWEQAALMDLMGYRVDQRPAGLVAPTELYHRTFWLDDGWNTHRWSTPGPEHPRVMHATMHEDREQVMRDWAAGRIPKVPDLPCRHMYAEPICPFCREAQAA